MTPLDKLTPLQRWGTCCPNDPECDHSFLDNDIFERYMDTPLSAIEAEMVVRGWSKDVLRDVRAALPEGCYLGREGVVRAERTMCASPNGMVEKFTPSHHHKGCTPLFVIEPVEADQ